VVRSKLPPQVIRRSSGRLALVQIRLAGSAALGWRSPADPTGTLVGDGEAGGLTREKSVASSLAIHQAPAAGGEPLSWRQQVEVVPVEQTELGGAVG
jgi:hypothetical protein